MSLLCLLQLLPSIVAPRLRKHNVRTARRSGSVVLRPPSETLPWEVQRPWFCFWTYNHKQEVPASQSHRATSSFCLQGGGIELKLPKTKLYQCLLLQHPLNQTPPPRYPVSQSAPPTRLLIVFLQLVPKKLIENHLSYSLLFLLQETFIHIISYKQVKSNSFYCLNWANNSTFLPYRWFKQLIV